MAIAPHKSRSDVVSRLSKIEGHVNGIKKMVYDCRDCPEILIQIAAVKSALANVARIVLEDHMETCLLEALKSGKAERSIADLREAISKCL